MHLFKEHHLDRDITKCVSCCVQSAKLKNMQPHNILSPNSRRKMREVPLEEKLCPFS